MICFLARKTNRGYGFVVDGMTNERYFLQADIVGPEAWEYLRTGDLLECKVGPGPDGRPRVIVADWPAEEQVAS